MLLDTTTILVIQTLLLFLTGAVFIFETALSRDNTAGPIWSLGYLLAMLSSIAHIVAHIEPALARLGAIGDATAVLATGAIWCGIRRSSGKRAVLWVPAIAGAITGITSYLSTAAHHPAVGTALTQIAFTLLAFLIAREAFTVRDGRIFSARVLGVAACIGSIYCGLRALTLLTGGPQSDIYQRYFGSASSGLVAILFIAVITTLLTTLRSATPQTASPRHAGTAVETYGTLPPDTMNDLATESLLRARDQGAGIAVIEATIDDLGEINKAFGRPFGDESIGSFAKILKRTICPLALISHTGAGNFTIITPAPTKKDANRIVDDLQKMLLDTPLAQMGELRLIASFGIAHSNNSGYNLDLLLEKAHLKRAQSRTPNLNTLAITLPGLNRS